MSVQSEIDRLAAARDDIADAIEAQGVTVPAGTKLAGLAALVEQIVGKVRSVCGKGPDTSGNIALTYTDVGAAASGHTHAAATSGTAGFLSAADKKRLDAVRLWTVTVPASAWAYLAGQVQPGQTASDPGGYAATVSVSGMTDTTQVVGVALASSYVGNPAAEQAAAAWTYLETGTDSVTLYAPLRPDAAFGLVLAALPSS